MLWEQNIFLEQDIIMREHNKKNSCEKKKIVYLQYNILFPQHIILFPQYVMFPQHIILFPKYIIINAN
jgi:hypothetical protein